MRQGRLLIGLSLCVAVLALDACGSSIPKFVRVPWQVYGTADGGRVLLVQWTQIECPRRPAVGMTTETSHSVRLVMHEPAPPVHSVAACLDDAPIYTARVKLAKPLAGRCLIGMRWIPSIAYEIPSPVRVLRRHSKPYAIVPVAQSVIGADKTDAAMILRLDGEHSRFVGSGSMVIAQTPQAGAIAPGTTARHPRGLITLQLGRAH